MREGLSIRGLAAKALIDIEKGDLSTDLLNRITEEGDRLEDRDRRFLRELVYGVLENKTYLDYRISLLMKKKSRIKPMVRQLLRIAVYELLFLSTPDHAAVHEAVSLVKKADYHASGFANAVLRRISDGEDEPVFPEGMDRLEGLSIRYSHPLWMVRLLADLFDPDDLEAVLAKNNRPAPLSIFVNPTKISRQKAYDRLKEDLPGLRLSSLSDHALLCDGGRVTDHELFREGAISIQGQASIRAAELAVEGLADKPVEILDLCSSPGSKAMAMAALAPGAHVVANDLTDEKAKRIRENIVRIGADRIETSVRDGREFYPDWAHRFDLVLVDAPCSGLGLLRRKPDIRWKRSEEDLVQLQDLQGEILDQAVKYIKGGGRLVYSTCTYGRMENEDQVDRLLARSDLKSEEIAGRKHISYHPLMEDSDGFFIARFRRRS